MSTVPEQAKPHPGYTTYVGWGPAKILYLAHLASGMEPGEIIKVLPNQKKIARGRNGKPGETGLGIQMDTVSQWRHRDPGWADAEQRTIQNPIWFTDTIALPVQLSALNARDIEYILRIPGAGEWKGFQGKAREMLLAQMKRINNPDSDGDKLITLLKSVTLEIPAHVMPKLAAPAQPEYIDAVNTRIEEDQHGR